MNLLAKLPSWIALHQGTSAMIACGFGVALVGCMRCLESDESQTERARRKKAKELRAVVDKISLYGRKVHHRFPTGEVVVCERDLAELLRKHPDLVASALSVLLRERRVQRVPLSGYWKLNV